jgi:WD40 repeat protein
VLKGHLQSINAVALSPDRGLIASAGADGYIRLWENGSGRERKVLMGGQAGSFDALDFSPDGELIAGAGWDGIIRIWQTVSGVEVCQLKGHDGMINRLQFSPDGNWLASGGYDGTIYLWRKNLSQRLFWTHMLQFTSTHSILNPHEGWVTSLAFSPDSQQLASVGWNGTAKLWTVETGQPIGTVENNQVMMQAIAFHPDGKKFVTAGGNDRALTLWDANTRQRIKTLAGKSYIFAQAGFMPNGQHLITACSDGQLRVINWMQGGCINRMVAHEKRINALAISRSGRTIVTGSADRTVKVWNLRKHV